ncbi:hypothetical protein EF888_11980 [Silicimonas algicola]|uniref:Uncharacterized protein n=1 Tax=Silicimonas algicola TaxID=1826607 RepID=A0A316GA58_9RHOB|nr:hypothetical protein [Silicimonas algicola]AZQ67790.1 hypothetical protein EF888_11980 [Silicimonas algicola]PWK57794.1 hypothetical protein C8D95_102442 [Silicimonas algicola]
MNRLALSGAILALTAIPALANDFEPAMRGFLEDGIQSWASNQVLIDAIRNQNAATGGYDQTRIDALDQTWRAEVGTGATPTIDPVLGNSAADFLREQVSKSNGRITEAFIMDAHGLNVASSAVTSDYWQGDEDKFQKTHDVGPDAVHFGDVEFDESSQTYQGQISITIVDPDTGAPIGAMTVGVDAESLL